MARSRAFNRNEAPPPRFSAPAPEAGDHNLQASVRLATATGLLLNMRGRNRALLVLHSWQRQTSCGFIILQSAYGAASRIDRPLAHNNEWKAPTFKEKNCDSPSSPLSPPPKHHGATWRELSLDIESLPSHNLQGYLVFVVWSLVRDDTHRNTLIVSLVGLPLPGFISPATMPPIRKQSDFF
ncbi:hypothetical protein MRX96_014238 [Rhipicephalus microplus]